MNNLLTRSFLSYSDLKKEAAKDLEVGGEDPREIGIQMSKTDEILRQFFEEAGLVKEEMTSIRGLLSLLETANEESKLAVKPEASGALHDRMNAHITEVLNSARRIRERLEGMDRATSANRRLSGCREGSPVDRTISSVTNGLRKKLKELMTDFQGLRQRMMTDYRQDFAETGEVPLEAAVKKMILEGKSVALVAAHEIRDQHDASEEVERSLLELHQVFLDMAIIVEAQGEKMDDIEHHVKSAAHYVKGGAKELNSAKTYQRSSRKCFLIASILVLVLIMLVVIPVATTGLKKS
ncbi:Syntaxin-related protein KNOLLE [Platanthera guangdongensis]|uniref:Syntaxin-related protein KNOLLE n=1 Tax=Platanthera guangdongensis TaxID=2320717 RepID=A0ABR2N5G4_9ASPA